MVSSPIRSRITNLRNLRPNVRDNSKLNSKSDSTVNPTLENVPNVRKSSGGFPSRGGSSLRGECKNGVAPKRNSLSCEHSKDGGTSTRGNANGNVADPRSSKDGSHRSSLEPGRKSSRDASMGVGERESRDISTGKQEFYNEKHGFCFGPKLRKSYSNMLAKAGSNGNNENDEKKTDGSFCSSTNIAPQMASSSVAANQQPSSLVKLASYTLGMGSAGVTRETPHTVVRSCQSSTPLGAANAPTLRTLANPATILGTPTQFKNPPICEAGNLNSAPIRLSFPRSLSVTSLSSSSATNSNSHSASLRWQTPQLQTRNMPKLEANIPLLQARQTGTPQLGTPGAPPQVRSDSQARSKPRITNVRPISVQSGVKVGDAVNLANGARSNPVSPQSSGSDEKSVSDQPRRPPIIKSNAHPPPQVLVRNSRHFSIPVKATMTPIIPFPKPILSTERPKFGMALRDKIQHRENTQNPPSQQQQQTKNHQKHPSPAESQNESERTLMTPSEPTILLEGHEDVLKSKESKENRTSPKKTTTPLEDLDTLCCSSTSVALPSCSSTYAEDDNLYLVEGEHQHRQDKPLSGMVKEDEAMTSSGGGDVAMVLGGEESDVREKVVATINDTFAGFGSGVVDKRSPLDESNISEAELAENYNQPIHCIHNKPVRTSSKVCKAFSDKMGQLGCQLGERVKQQDNHRHEETDNSTATTMIGMKPIASATPNSKLGFNLSRTPISILRPSLELQFFSTKRPSLELQFPSYASNLISVLSSSPTAGGCTAAGGSVEPVGDCRSVEPVGGSRSVEPVGRKSLISRPTLGAQFQLYPCGIKPHPVSSDSKLRNTESPSSADKQDEVCIDGLQQAMEDRLPKFENATQNQDYVSTSNSTNSVTAQFPPPAASVKEASRPANRSTSRQHSRSRRESVKDSVGGENPNQLSELSSENPEQQAHDNQVQSEDAQLSNYHPQQPENRGNDPSRVSSKPEYNLLSQQSAKKAIVQGVQGQHGNGSNDAQQEEEQHQNPILITQENGNQRSDEMIKHMNQFIREEQEKIDEEVVPQRLNFTEISPLVVGSRGNGRGLLVPSSTTSNHPSFRPNYGSRNYRNPFSVVEGKYLVDKNHAGERKQSAERSPSASNVVGQKEENYMDQQSYNNIPQNYLVPHPTFVNPIQSSLQEDGSDIRDGIIPNTHEIEQQFHDSPSLSPVNWKNSSPNDYRKDLSHRKNSSSSRSRSPKSARRDNEQQNNVIEVNGPDNTNEQGQNKDHSLNTSIEFLTQQYLRNRKFIEVEARLNEMPVLNPGRERKCIYQDVNEIQKNLNGVSLNTVSKPNPALGKNAKKRSELHNQISKLEENIQKSQKKRDEAVKTCRHLDHAMSHPSMGMMSTITQNNEAQHTLNRRLKNASVTRSVFHKHSEFSKVAIDCDNEIINFTNQKVHLQEELQKLEHKAEELFIKEKKRLANNAGVDSSLPPNFFQNGTRNTTRGNSGSSLQFSNSSVGPSNPSLKLGSLSSGGEHVTNLGNLGNLGHGNACDTSHLSNTSNIIHHLQPYQSASEVIDYINECAERKCRDRMKQVIDSADTAPDSVLNTLEEIRVSECQLEASDYLHDLIHGDNANDEKNRKKVILRSDFAKTTNRPKWNAGSTGNGWKTNQGIQARPLVGPNHLLDNEYQPAITNIIRGKKEKKCHTRNHAQGFNTRHINIQSNPAVSAKLPGFGSNIGRFGETRYDQEEGKIRRNSTNNSGPNSSAKKSMKKPKSSTYHKRGMKPNTQPLDQGDYYQQYTSSQQLGRYASSSNRTPQLRISPLQIQHRNSRDTVNRNSNNRVIVTPPGSRGFLQQHKHLTPLPSSPQNRVSCPSQQNKVSCPSQHDLRKAGLEEVLPLGGLEQMYDRRDDRRESEELGGCPNPPIPPLNPSPTGCFIFDLDGRYDSRFERKNGHGSTPKPQKSCETNIKESCESHIMVDSSGKQSTQHLFNEPTQHLSNSLHEKTQPLQRSANVSPSRGNTTVSPSRDRTPSGGRVLTPIGGSPKKNSPSKSYSGSYLSCKNTYSSNGTPVLIPSSIPPRAVSGRTHSNSVGHRVENLSGGRIGSVSAGPRTGNHQRSSPDSQRRSGGRNFSGRGGTPIGAASRTSTPPLNSSRTPPINNISSGRLRNAREPTGVSPSLMNNANRISARTIEGFMATGGNTHNMCTTTFTSNVESAIKPKNGGVLDTLMQALENADKLNAEAAEVYR